MGIFSTGRRYFEKQAVPFPSDRSRRAAGEGKGESASATGGEGEAGPEERLRPLGRRAGRQQPLPHTHGGAAAAEAGRGSRRFTAGGWAWSPTAAAAAAAMEKQPGGEDDCVDSGAETGG